MSSSDPMTTSTPPPQSQPHPSIPVHASLPTSSAPPAKISSHCHLDPSSYVKGRHQLTIEANAIVHPRTYLFTELGPITIKQGTIITEKCIIGRREKSDSSNSQPQSHKRGSPSTASASISISGRPLSIIEGSVLTARTATTTTESTEQNAASTEGNSTLPTITIGPNAHLHASCTLLPPCTMSDSSVLEPGVVISPNVTVGAHTKVCAGITIPTGTTIPEWTVVYGVNGNIRYRRRLRDQAEESRLDVLRRERAGVEALLKTNANKTLAGAAGGGASEGTTRRSKRESMIRG